MLKSIKDNSVQNYIIKVVSVKCPITLCSFETTTTQMQLLWTKMLRLINDRIFNYTALRFVCELLFFTMFAKLS